MHKKKKLLSRLAKIISGLCVFWLLAETAHAEFRMDFAQGSSSRLDSFTYPTPGPTSDTDATIGYSYGNASLTGVTEDFTPYVREELNPFTTARAVYAEAGVNPVIDPGLVAPSGASISWLVDGALIPGENSPVLTLPSMAESEFRNVVLRVVFGGETYDFAYQVTVRQRLAFNPEPMDITTAENKTVEFTVRLTRPPSLHEIPSSIQWHEVGVGPLPAATSSTLTISNTVLEDSGRSFFAVAETSHGTATSRTATLEVRNDFPPVIVSQPDVLVVWPGHVPFPIKGRLSGSEPMETLWEFSPDGVQWGSIDEIGNSTGYSVYDHGLSESFFETRFFTSDFPASTQGGFLRFTAENIGGSAVSQPIPIVPFVSAPVESWTETLTGETSIWTSPSVEPGEQTALQTLIAPDREQAQLRFRWKVDGALPGRILRFVIDGSVRATYTGDGEWTEARVDAPTFGASQVEWQFSAESGASPASGEVAMVEVLGFFVPTYKVSITANGGSVLLSSPEPEFPANTQLTATAIPDEGNEFAGWSGISLAGSTVANTVPFTVRNDVNLTARFGREFDPALIGSSGLQFTRGGLSLWHLQDQLTRNGKPLGLGYIGSSGWIETTVTGPGTFSYWQNGPVNTQLSIRINGSTVPSVVASGRWKQETLAIGEGSHVIRLTGPFAGASLSGLDDIVFIPGSIPLRALELQAENGTIVANPAKTLYEDGETVTLTAVPDSGYEFVGWTGDLSGSESTDTIVMSAGRSVTARFRIPFSSPLISPSALPLVFSGDADWEINDSVTRPGRNYSLRSGNNDRFSISAVETTLVGPGTLTYWRKVSSDPSEVFRSYLGSVVVESVSGESDWKMITREIPDGTHVFRWEYDKSFSLGGLDAVFIDGLVFTGPSMGFDDWQILHELPADRRGPLDRNGPMGLPNLIAYGMGINPMFATQEDLPNVQSVNHVARTAKFKFRRASGEAGQILSVLTSTTLTPGSWEPIDSIGETVTTFDDHEIVEISLNLIPGESSQFFVLSAAE